MTLPRPLSAHRLAAVVVVVASLLMFTRPADAAFKMRLTQGASVMTIVDNGVNDLSSTVGQIVFSGAVGNYQINTVTGLSKGVLASSPHEANMDLSSVDTSCVSAACAAAANLTLTIELTDTGFFAMPANGALYGTVGGTANGTALFQGYVSTTNAEFATSAIDTSIGPFTDSNAGVLPTAFSGKDTQAHGSLPAYSMTMIATITHPRTRALSTSFNFALDNVPEPATLALFWIGLATVAVAARRRQQSLRAVRAVTASY